MVEQSLPRQCILGSVQELQQQLLLLKDRQGSLELDASAVETIDAAGLQVINSLISSRNRAGHSTVIVKPSDTFRQLSIALAFDNYLF